MAVDVKNVQGRRVLRFDSLEAILADAEALVAAPRVRTLGNWPLNPLLTHVALAIDASMDGIAFRAPWFIRLVAPLIKGRVLRRGLSPGFKLPKAGEDASFIPAPTLEEALEQLRRATLRARTTPMTACHPVFGQLTDAQWRQFHCRHAEMHFSFVRSD